MLKQIAEGVWVHESEFLKSHAVVVQGNSGVLLIDPGITSSELANIADDLHKLGQPVVAGFSTHPHWDHVLWHTKFGKAPRYGTARGEAVMKDLLSNADWRSQLADELPPEHAEEIPLDELFGQITGLPPKTTHLPWDGPKVRVIEHQAHSQGHAALLIEETGVLVVGDMLSDILIPFLDLQAADPAGDYLATLQLFEDEADNVKAFVPGHGSVGDADQLCTLIKQDRAYVQTIRDGGNPSDDPRLTEGPNKDWLPGVHEWQAQQLAQKREHDGAPELLKEE